MISTCLLIAALLVAAEGAPVSARAVLDAAEIPFHHVARYRVTVEAPAGLEIAVEPWVETLPGLDAAPGEPSATLLPDGRKQFVQEFTLTPSIVRRYTLPATRVLAGGAEAAILAPQELAIRDLTAEEKAEASVAAELLTLADLEESGTRPWRGTALALLAIAAVLLAGLAIFGYLRRRIASRPVLSPREVAEAGLAGLERELQAGAIACDAYFVSLSHLLRTYLCTSFDPNVAGQSTPEFLATTLAALPLPAAHAGAVRELLREFDGVKFAQHSPDRDGQARSLRAVRHLIGALENEAASRAAQALRGAA